MRKANNKEYKLVVKAKSMVDEIMEMCDYDIEKIARYIVNQKEYRWKVALATVFCTGEFYNGNQFFMPATADCCRNFKDAEKRMKQKRPLMIHNEYHWGFEWGCTREYENYGIFDGSYKCWRTVEENEY